MATLRVQSVLHMTSGLPADSVVSTWFCSTDVVAGTFISIRTAWLNFQDDISVNYPATVAQNGHDIKIYDMADVEPRVPIYEATWDFGSAPSGATLPSEVALCISYQAVRLSGVDQKNRRGRMYLGPLVTGLMASGRPGPATIEAVGDAFETFVAALAADDIVFGIYSRTLEEFHGAVDGWIDNSFDTQRRRGLEPTARELLSFV